MFVVNVRVLVYLFWYEGFGLLLFEVLVVGMLVVVIDL